MKVLYISSVPSEKQFNYMKSVLKQNEASYGMQESGYKFHHLIMDGLIDNDVNVYSLIGRPISRNGYKGLIWKNEKECYDDITYEHIGLINLPVIKNIFVSIAYFFKTLKWIKQNKNEEKCIIVDAAYITVLPFINLATMIRKCKKIAIVCDIYEYMAPVKDARAKSNPIHKYIAKILSNSYKKIDGFVFLTEAMTNILNKKNVPYIVMEGLVDKNMKTNNISFENKSQKDMVLYAGSLNVKYGIKNLVEGFKDYKNDNAELLIYGAGAYSEDIKKIGDKRIKYCGVKPNSEVVKKEQKAWLLVNPRGTKEEFTKYSFPSKNMEYMVSGTPVLSTKLPGMPKEYYNYIFTIDGEEKEDVTKALEKVFKNTKKELYKKGTLSKDYVLKKKNNVVQAQRILNLCNKVIHNDKR